MCIPTYQYVSEIGYDKCNNHLPMFLQQLKLSHVSLQVKLSHQEVEWLFLVLKMSRSLSTNLQLSCRIQQLAIYLYMYACIMMTILSVLLGVVQTLHTLQLFYIKLCICVQLCIALLQYNISSYSYYTNIVRLHAGFV